MKQLLCSLLVLVIGFAAVGMAQAAEEKAKKKADPEAVFKKLDANSDGKVTMAEFTAKKKDKEAAEKQFKAKDKDGNGELTLEEFKAPVAKKKAKKAG
jgi:Ca2+-binding EF-hand superfamily protein